MKPVQLRIISITLLICMIMTVSHSQTKMIEIQRERWIFEAWATLASIGYVGGDHNGLQLDVLNIRGGYFSIGLWSSYIFSPLIEEFLEDSEFFGFNYWAPFGLYYPLFVGKNYVVGIDSRAYLFRDRDHYPAFGELSLRLDLKYAASFQLGMRIPDKDFVYNGQGFNFSGVFFNISAGLQILGVNRITRNVSVPGPPPRLSVRWDRREDEILLAHDSPSREIDLIIANDGEGIAEDVELDIRLGSPPATDILLANTRPHLGDFPDRSVKGAQVIIEAKEEIKRYEEIPITFYLTEKDGFRAERSYRLVLLPEVQAEQYPPVLSTEIEFRDAHNSGVLHANESAEIELNIRNEGRGNAWSLEGTVELLSDHAVPGLELPETDFQVRLIKSGESGTVRIPVRTTRELPTTDLEFMVTMQEANGFDPEPVRFTLAARELQPPQLAITDITFQNEAGESFIVPVDVVQFTVRISNEGEGIAEDVVVMVTPGENVFIAGGEGGSYREWIGTINPGTHREVTFEAFCNRRAEGFPLVVSITERKGEYGISDHRIEFEVQHGGQ